MFPVIRFELLCFPRGQLIVDLSDWKLTVSTLLQLSCHRRSVLAKFRHTWCTVMPHVSRSGTLICKLKRLRCARNDWESAGVLVLTWSSFLSAFIWSYLASWMSVWWCPWRFCSWSCLLHTLHIYPPASKSRIHHHSPLSVHRWVESFIYPTRTVGAVTLWHRKATHLTLAAHTHAVGVLVWAPGAVQNHSVREGNSTRLFGLAMQVAAFVSCQTNTERRFLTRLSIQWVQLWFSERASSQWVSITLHGCLSQTGAPGASRDQACQTSTTRANPSVHASPLQTMMGSKRVSAAALAQITRQQTSWSCAICLRNSG